MPFVNYNGEIVDSSQPIFTHANRAFRYGDALFESIRLMNGEILYFEKHLERLAAGMKYLGMTPHQDFSFQNLYLLIRHLDQVNQLKGNGRIRFEVFRGDGGLYAPDANNVNYLIEGEPMEHKEYMLNENGLRLDYFTEVSKPISRLSNFKTANAMCYVLAGLHKQKNGFDDCIILNANGNVAECISSNIFMVIKNDVLTPALTEGCTAGVFRDAVIDLLKARNKNILETKITQADLLKADEIFLTNVSMGIRWVGALKEKRYFNTMSKWLLQELKAVVISH